MSLLRLHSCAHLTVLDFLQSAVCPDSKECLCIRGDGDPCVAAGLEHAVGLSGPTESIPLVHRPVHAT